jgi:hypothetical protein
MRSRGHLLWLFWLVAACGDDSKAVAPGPVVDAGLDAPELCPDPQHPRVHYESADTAVCAATELRCTEAQNGFDNACGCGCIDKGDPLCPVVVDPNITWWSRDPAQCPDAGLPACPLNDIAFSNSCGCGCKKPGV